MKSRFINIFNTKRKRNGAIILLTVILAMCVAGGLVACTVDKQDTDESGAEAEADIEVKAEADAIAASEYIYENMGYTVRLPEEYRDKVTLLDVDEMDSNTIIEIYQTATLEKHPEAGFLFRIVRHTPAEFEDYWPGADETGGYYHFAKDESYYYSIQGPTDVQADVDEREEYQWLKEQKGKVISWFIENNNLTEYYHSISVYEAEFTYPGDHALYLLTLSNDAEFEVVLSKPIRQDESGIWCVERMYDEYENLYIAMPDTDLTVMEYYEQLQAEADAGQRPELLDAEDVALYYLENVWDYARHIKESSIEYING